MKELNYRLTVTEKFWSDECGKAVLQQRANDPSDQRPTDNIQATATRSGIHSCTTAAKTNRLTPIRKNRPALYPIFAATFSARPSILLA